MENHNVKIGKIGEQKATTYLKTHGYKILDRNFRVKTGEIDIIAQKGNILAFIEVKTRTQTKYGVPCEAVNYYKRKNIYETAQMYLLYNKLDMECRFDVVEVMLSKNVFGYVAKINHIINAFEE